MCGPTTALLPLAAAKECLQLLAEAKGVVRLADRAEVAHVAVEIEEGRAVRSLCHTRCTESAVHRGKVHAVGIVHCVWRCSSLLLVRRHEQRRGGEDLGPAPRRHDDVLARVEAAHRTVHTLVPRVTRPGVGLRGAVGVELRASPVRDHRRTRELARCVACALVVPVPRTVHRSCSTPTGGARCGCSAQTVCGPHRA